MIFRCTLPDGSRPETITRCSPYNAAEDYAKRIDAGSGAEEDTMRVLVNNTPIIVIIDRSPTYSAMMEDEA